MTNLLGMVAALVIHEAGHALATVSLGLKIRAVGISWKGPYVRREAGKTPMQDALIAVAGPVANLLLAIAWPEAALGNLAIALVCLAPLPNSDGTHLLAAVHRLRPRGQHHQ